MAARQTRNEKGGIDDSSPIIAVTEWLRIGMHDKIGSDRS